MKVIKTDTESAVIQKWFKEIGSFLVSPALSHIEVKHKNVEFTELDIFYDNNQHVFRIKFQDQTYQNFVNQLINPLPLFRRELRSDEIEALKELTDKVSAGNLITIP